MATLYVSNSASNGYALGNDVNDGLTKADPKLSIEAAVSASANGDTIIVNDGVYTALTNFVLNKAIVFLPETEYGVELRAPNVTTQVIDSSHSSGLQSIGKLTCVGNGHNAVINRTQSTGDWTLDMPRIVGEGAGVNIGISDSSRSGDLLIGFILRGIISSNGYLGTQNAGITANKTITFDGIDIGDREVFPGTGTFNLISITRYGTNPGGLVDVLVKNITGRILANTGASNSVVNGVIGTNLSNAVIEDVDLEIEKEGLTASVECLGVMLRSTSTTAAMIEGIIRRCVVDFLCPAGSAIMAGQGSGVDYSQKILAYDNKITGKYYPVATPHGLYIGGQGQNSKAYRNYIRSIYAGIIQSICNGSKVFNNITDGIYGVDLYSKGCGATLRPVFANNTMLKRNLVGDMRAELNAMTANAQGATPQIDCLYVNNKVVVFDMLPRIVRVISGQNATFERNHYPANAKLAANSFNWQGTSYATVETWAAKEADAVKEFDGVTDYGDGKTDNFSSACHAGKSVTGVTDSGEEDPFGNEFATSPNIGADQGAAKGLGPWTPFDSTMPSLALAPTAPGSLLEVQEWSKPNITKKQIDKASR